MTTHMDYCDIISTTLKSLYRGIWVVRYISLDDNYIIDGPNGEKGKLEGKKLRENRFSAKKFVGYIESVLGRPN